MLNFHIFFSSVELILLYGLKLDFSSSYCCCYGVVVVELVFYCQLQSLLMHCIAHNTYMVGACGLYGLVDRVLDSRSKSLGFDFHTGHV